MTISPELQKRIRRSIFSFRAIGWAFVIFATGFIICGIFMLYDPSSVVTVNGVKRTDMSAKLPFVFFPLIHLGIGLLMALSPKSWLTKFIIGQVDRRRRFAACLPGPLKKWLGY
jgi:hypothetical protein